MYLVDLESEQLGRDLCRDRVRAGTEVSRRAAHVCGTVAADRHRGLAGGLGSRDRDSGVAVTDHPVSVAYRPELGRTPRPAESFGADAVALTQCLARPRQTRPRMNLSVVAQPQLDRDDAQWVGQLVQRGLHRDVGL